MSWAIVSSVGALSTADVTPPVISAISSGTPAASTATITWTTDEASDSQVEYGLTTSYGSSSSLNGSLVTSHSVGLTGLASNTLHHFRAKSRDLSGNLATSADQTLTTAVAPFAPTDVAGLQVWLKADAGTFTDNGFGTPSVADGDPVGGWTNQIGALGSANTGDASMRPTLKTGANGLNGKSVLRFDSANLQQLETANLSTLFPTAAALFVVVRINTDTTYVIVDTHAIDDYWLFNGGDGYIGAFRSSRVESYPASPFMPSSGNAIFTVISSASTYEVLKNGASAGATTAGFSAGTAWRIGGPYLGGASGKYFNGDIAEILAYDSVLSTPNRQAVEAYLNTRWAVY